MENPAEPAVRPGGLSGAFLKGKNPVPAFDSRQIFFESHLTSASYLCRVSRRFCRVTLAALHPINAIAF